ncbi:ribosomal protein S18-alanine N-acetyltransferase [Ileibacterium valens]|uniref:[Ribosomal protein bS18]-alanine N-acetyltransferase n=1 Tax=Ileibacterium valens TaxID=1862668 RepID=A0A1U7NIN2_9FIRM|nr:ribosomal protein S18-alanine N-acetyltransferase [Ileibacterium valens]OLU36669.1 ribosomal-protein-alanine N-acetyltransferase [Erysipelotrichaceae bacterium NYU-BL-F16]OLU40757.1 ribosomal-protein-alanine N-acetyltransferase [Erysipelotrichaceae bacterium NYU-BL-E8]OLU42410.1 ribosomal-protein-alanine N-acetyltransferase [Ileibacterium valens]
MIRQANEQDLKALARLEGRSFQNPWTIENIQQDLKVNPFSTILVDEEDGRIRAYLDLWITFEKAQIARIATDPEFRKQGLAKALIQKGIEMAQEQQAEEFSLDVRVSNQPAIALYESMGFIILHRSKNYYEGKEDGLLMAMGI